MAIIIWRKVGGVCLKKITYLKVVVINDHDVGKTSFYQTILE